MAIKECSNETKEGIIDPTTSLTSSSKIFLTTKNIMLTNLTETITGSILPFNVGTVGSAGRICWVEKRKEEYYKEPFVHFVLFSIPLHCVESKPFEGMGWCSYILYRSCPVSTTGWHINSFLTASIDKSITYPGGCPGEWQQRLSPAVTYYVQSSSKLGWSFCHLPSFQNLFKSRIKKTFILFVFPFFLH